MFRFLPGILLVQLITCGLLLTAINGSDEPALLIVLAVFGLGVALFAALWFASLSQLGYRDEIAKMQNAHAQEREKLLLAAEREKSELKTETVRQAEQAARRLVARANFKVGAMFTAAAAAGALMLFTQFITLGTIILVAAVSGLSGYLVRGRQQRRVGFKAPAESVAQRLLRPPQSPIRIVEKKQNKRGGS